jgi:hypothetical protein
LNKSIEELRQHTQDLHASIVAALERNQKTQTEGTPVGYCLLEAQGLLHAPTDLENVEDSPSLDFKQDELDTSGQTRAVHITAVGEKPSVDSSALTRICICMQRN